MTNNSTSTPLTQEQRLRALLADGLMTLAKALYAASIAAMFMIFVAWSGSSPKGTLDGDFPGRFSFYVVLPLVVAIVLHDKVRTVRDELATAAESA